MRIQSMPDTCTARHFYEFLLEFPEYNGQYNRREYDERLASQRSNLITQLNLARQSRIVNVFAFLIGTQASSRAQLEELGFTCVSDLNNYKYPDTSRRLFLMVRDMNDWVEPAAPVVTNTFVQAAPVVAQPAPNGPVRDANGRFAARPQYRLVDTAGWAHHPDGPWTVERLIAYYMNGYRFPNQGRGLNAITREDAIAIGARAGYLIPN